VAGLLAWQAGLESKYTRTLKPQYSHRWFINCDRMSLLKLI
jgi:hypothetical protein